MKQVAVITGAGSGIGKELTKLFLADGHNVLAVSLLRRELEQLTAEMSVYTEQLSVLEMDLSLSDSPQILLNYCKDNDLFVETLVNNAGFACFGETVDLDVNKVGSMIRLNVECLTKTSLLFGREMKAAGRGNILNIGSAAGFVPVVRMAAYCASKSYVNNFSYALRTELAPFGVNVSCVTPTATKTNFAKAGGVDTYKGQSTLKNMFATNNVSTVESVAKQAYEGLGKRKASIMAGKGSAIAYIMSIFPKSMIPGLLKNA